MVDSGIVVNFADSQDDNFSRLDLGQRVDGFSNWLSANMNIDSLTPNYFLHQFGSPGLSGYLLPIITLYNK